MSWNNIIPWKVLDCMETCVGRDPATGYTIHVAGCKLGEEVAARQKADCDRACRSRDQRPDGGRYSHSEECPIGQELKQQEDYGSKKNSIGGDEKPQSVGESIKVGFAGVKPGSSDSDPNW